MWLADWFGMCISRQSSIVLLVCSMFVAVLKDDFHPCTIWNAFEVALTLFYLCQSLLPCRLFVSAYPSLCFSHSFLEKSGAKFALEQKFSKSGPGFSKYWVNSHPRMWWLILLKWSFILELNSRAYDFVLYVSNQMLTKIKLFNDKDEGSHTHYIKRSIWSAMRS